MRFVPPLTSDSKVKTEKEVSKKVDQMIEDYTLLKEKSQQIIQTDLL